MNAAAYADFSGGEAGDDLLLAVVGEADGSPSGVAGVVDEDGGGAIGDGAGGHAVHIEGRLNVLHAGCVADVDADVVGRIVHDGGDDGGADVNRVGADGAVDVE